jgi:hypothetical protein
MTRQTFPFPRASANNDFPYDPFSDTGDKNDPAQYIQPPGVVFFRPWLSIPGGSAFIWPLGIEGFSLTIDPTLGIHKYIGANAVAVNVMHRGEESITLSGSFPGDTGAMAMRALRDVVYAEQPPGGKILYLPGILPYAQRVAVGHTSFDRSADDRGSDLTYSIEFKRTGLAKKYPTPKLVNPTPQPRSAPKGGTSRVFKATATVHTLRAIAQLKLHDANKWKSIYDKNVKFFTIHKVPMHTVPTYKLPIGTKIYF